MSDIIIDVEKLNKIKIKIEKGEGMLYVQSEGWITAKEYDKLTDPKNKNYLYYQSLPILYKPNKKDYDIISNQLVLKIDIKDKYK